MALIAFICLHAGSARNSYKSANKFLIHLYVTDG